MPSSRARGGTRMPRAGDDTSLPPMAISPSVGCSRPATQRKVVVLPQPEGPSSTTISPAGTAKLTPSIAGRPTANCLRRSVTSSVAVMLSPDPSCGSSLPKAECLVPIGNPVGMQLHILVEVRIPDLDDLGIEALRINRNLLERGEVALLPDHEALAFLRQTPIEIEFCRIGVRRGLGDSCRVGVGRNTLRGKHHLHRCAFLLLRVDRVVEQRSHGDIGAHEG